MCLSNSENKATECFDLIYCDMWGAYHVPSSSGGNYSLSIVDDASKAAWVEKEKHLS